MTLALVTSHADMVLVALAWIFVALRAIHAVIHVSRNDVARRFFVYTAGFGVIAVMWLWFAVKVVAG